MDNETTNTTNILEMNNIVKNFPGVKALNKVDFSVKKGEIHGLIGENGAGKSTLIKILHGIYRADEGHILFNDKIVTKIHSTSKSHDIGIEFIHQNPRFVEYLNVAETISAGIEPTIGFINIINWKEVNKRTNDVFKSLDIDIQANHLIRDLSFPERQMVAIARAILRKAKMIVFDEPTSSLSEHEVVKLFETINRLKQQGVTIIYVSHRLEEIFEICDRVTIFRNGKNVITEFPSNLSYDDLIKLMTGLEKGKRYPNKLVKKGEVILSVKNLYRGNRIKNISFDLHKGEILGLAGLVGAGRTELVRVLFGADKKDSGNILYKGKEINFRSPFEAIQKGIVLVPEDRGTEGIVKKLDVKDNIILPSIDEFCHLSIINNKKVNATAKEMVHKINIVTPTIYQRTENLSGGNQQKVVFGKWIVSKGDVFLFDEATLGIDVGAKVEIFKLINDLAESGKAVIFISTDLEEVLGMSDRILIMRGGKIIREIQDIKMFSVDKVLHLVKGGG